MQQAKKPDLESVVKDYSPYGLTSVQVKSKLARYGENKFRKEKVSGLNIFFRQFMNPLSFILIFAAALSIFMGEYSDAAIIMVIVLLNSCLSFIQEFRSGKAVEKLSEFIERTCLVIRNNEQVIIEASGLVPGDTILLRAGDVIPADVKIIEAYHLSINESQLTGESIPVSKGTDDGNDLLYTGSVIEKGHCQGVVFATGNLSELGKIARLSRDTKKVTPYQKSLAEFSVWLLRLIGATVVLLLVIKAFTIDSAGDFAEIVLFAVALAMTSVPEALPMITTINLSYGALKLAKQNVIAKRLSAIEDLGRINLLCTDKTGTLTQDRLTVSDVISDDEALFQTFAFVSTEDFELSNKKHINSFDDAFLQYIPKAVKEKAGCWERLCTVPFDSALRRRRVIVQDPINGKTYLIVVGAPETLLLLSQNSEHNRFEQQIMQADKQGMRQLAIAYKEIDYRSDYDLSGNENNLIFLGFANLYDPLRETARAAIDMARDLGVDVKILSGDSPAVAAFIGREVGLLQAGDKIYTGDELETLDDAQFGELIQECSVFARVTPIQKYKIIKRLKQDFVVGYQGDGINDAPSLKLADVSIAVHNATDVAKDSADIVLLEDDLEVVVNGIQYGRSIFININKYIKHAMVGNLGNFFSLVFFYLVFAADIPMLAIQLLIGNIIQDMPLMAVFSDSVDIEEVRKPPAAGQVESVIKTSLSLGAFTAVCYLLFFLFTGTEATPLTQATLFLFYNFTQILVIISVRSKHHFFWQGARPSRILLGTIVLFIAVSAALVYLPFTASVMGFSPLPFFDLAVLTGASIAFIFLLDLVKVALNRWQTKRMISNS